MTTRSALFIQTETGEWLQAYCHFDGYPEHMIPALRHADPDLIRATGDIRLVHDNGQIEPLNDARPCEALDAPKIPSWASHAYLLTATGWKHCTTTAGPHALLD